MAGEALAKRNCVPCEKGGSPLPASAANALLADVRGWELATDGKAIHKTVKCADFLDAVRLIQQIAQIAEAQDHHPDLHLTNYRRLAIDLSTHAIGGLSENDFILAAKLNAILPA